MASSIERVHVAAPHVAAGGKVITSPFQFYSDGSENLRLRIWGSLVTNVGLQGRWLHTTGDVRPFRHEFVSTADRLPHEFNVSTDAGYLLNCSLGILGDTITRIGQLFVQLALVRGRGDAAVEVGTILQGYIATSHWIAFPGSPIQHSFEGPGYKHVEIQPAPAAGTEVILSVPEHALWRLYSAYAVFVASAAAANRFPQFGVNAGFGTTLWRVQAPLIVTAGLGFNIFWVPNVPWGPAATAIANAVNAPLPEPAYALSLGTIRTETPNIQAGDQWSELRVVVEEWLDTDFFGAPL